MAIHKATTTFKKKTVGELYSSYINTPENFYFDSSSNA